MDYLLYIFHKRLAQETNLGVDMDGIHHLLYYADDVNLIGGDIRGSRTSSRHDGQRAYCDSSKSYVKVENP